MEKVKQSIYLMLDFIKLGFFTFGGGWSIVAQMQKMYVEKQKTITEEELLDLTSVARSLPGAMIANVAMLYGYRCLGVLGGFLCIIGLTIPAMTMLSIIAIFYTAFRDNQWIATAMNGVRAAVVPIILSAAIGMVKGAFKYSPCIIVMILSLLLYLCFNLNCVYLVLIGAIAGIFICEFYERRHKGGKKQ